MNTRISWNKRASNDAGRPRSEIHSGKENLVIGTDYGNNDQSTESEALSI